MSKEVFLINFYCKNGFVLLVCIYIIFRFIRKKWFVFTFSGMLECKAKKWLIKHKKIISLSFNTLLILTMGIACWYKIVPAIRDIPHAINNEFVYFEGEVTKDSYIGSKNKMEQHNLYILDKNTSNIVYLQIYGRSEIRKGTIVKVAYLPYSLEGTLLSRNY